MSEQSGWMPIEDMNMFRDLERLSDEVWTIAAGWPPFARDTIGKQLADAVDSVGANLAEGDGRYHHRDKLNHYYIARGSLKETWYWIRRAHARKLVQDGLAADWGGRLEATRRWVNTMISKRRELLAEVRENPAPYYTSPKEA